MSAIRIGRTKQARRLRTRVQWLCRLTGLLAIAAVIGIGEQAGIAQSTTQPTEDRPVRPYPEQVNPASPNVLFVPYPVEGSSLQASEPTADQPAKESFPGTPGAQAAAVGQPVKQEERIAITDPNKKQIVDDTANLLKLANSLKAEVEKTTPDTLSVTVVRQASEIEKLAHKMRSK